MGADDETASGQLICRLWPRPSVDVFGSSAGSGAACALRLLNHSFVRSCFMPR
jgi:hypothetical protein